MRMERLDCTGVYVCVCLVPAVSPGPRTQAITVTSDNLDDFTPVNTGSVDFYTADFRIENPTNRTFENVEVQVTLNPVVAFCHIQSATFKIQSLAPREKKTEQIRLSPSFSDLDCAYNFTSSVNHGSGLVAGRFSDPPDSKKKVLCRNSIFLRYAAPPYASPLPPRGRGA